MSKKEEAEYEEYESLKNSKFKQQKLPGWRPVPSMIRTATIFISLGIIFAGLGVLILLFSNNVEEVIKRYDNDEDCENNKICHITIPIKKRMKKNIYIYYQLEGFYQNHRRYMSSKSEDQLKGNFITLTDMKKRKECDPAITIRQMEINSDIMNKRNIKNLDGIAIPCGLMAKNYFNDSYKIWKDRSKTNEIRVNETNIARKSDREKYKRKSIQGQENQQWIDLNDEHFLVWMRPSPLPNFTKLWGRIESDLEEGNITVEIENNYNVSHFEGEKYLVLRTLNNIGGKNTILYISYIVFGGICLILGIIFIFAYKAHEKKEK